jgi:hypothetical protein
VGGFTTSFSWIAGGPDEMSFTISGSGDSASLTPDRTGIYDVGLRITVQDTTQRGRTFDAVQRSHVIVPDQFTETFEHANLADRLPWKTFGNAPWKTESTSAQTGTFSAEAGTLVGNQLDTVFSALEIHVSVPRDTIIVFSVRTSTTFILDRFEFRVDGRLVSFIYGYTDWTILKYPIEAGEHTLTWTSMQYTATPSRIWLDNVFFPGNAVVNSTGEHGGIPLEFRLFQNFPNPFNPTTIIRYGLPARSYVNLTVFNSLGQQVGVLVNGETEAGYHEVKFDGANLASGVYFYTIRVRMSDAASQRSANRGAGEIVETRKLLLLR